MVPAMVLFLLSPTTIAQVMLIHKSDGSTIRIAVADINKITFNLGGSTGTAPNPVAMKKIKAVLANVFPNPFCTRITYNVLQPSNVRINVFNMQGRLVRVLKSGMMAAGSYTENWNGTDDNGRMVSNGCFIVKIEIGDKTVAKNFLILR
jgi:hypothetical protein